MKTVKMIRFSGCTGFGSLGRSATLYWSDDSSSLGFGEDDREAVLSALIDDGFTYDAAFDRFAEVIRVTPAERAIGCPE